MRFGMRPKEEEGPRRFSRMPREYVDVASINIDAWQKVRFKVGVNRSICPSRIHYRMDNLWYGRCASGFDLCLLEYPPPRSMHSSIEAPSNSLFTQSHLGSCT